MSTRAPAVTARQLIKTYPGDVTALRGMDLDVDAGTVFGLLGPNGAGKSTTVKILTTLARPDSGTASVAGHDVLRHPDRVRRVIGVVARPREPPAPGQAVRNAGRRRPAPGRRAAGPLRSRRRREATPVSRNALMNANVVQNGISTAVQSVIIVLLGRAAGADYPGGATGLLILVVGSILLGTVFGALSNALGMLVRQRESIIGINTFLLLPLTFLSSSFMAPSHMPSWMRHIADFNPVDWAMVAGRSALTADPEWGLVLSRGGALLVLAVAAVWLSTRTFRSYQKSV
ncbi:ABC transporter permease [Streptomyces sp. NPDC088846]|uniref:ABC transporter permease n=1 Tax=Streptomyces sp. NPDC088846 TaxID=3365908 RepID=UPI0037F5C0AE